MECLLILSVTILIGIGVELLLPQPQHHQVYQDSDLKDYMSGKSFEYKENELIYARMSDALFFLRKNEHINEHIKEHINEHINETKKNIKKTSQEE